MAPDNRHESAMNVAQAAPSVVAILVTKVFDFPIEKWVGVAGLAFLALQAGYLIWKWRRDIRRDRAGHAGDF